jgi:phosphoglycerate dehydrogenase-like enzyme
MNRFATIVIPESDSRLKPFADRLKPLAHTIRTYDAPIKSADELIERIGNADAVLPMGGTRLDSAVIGAATELRYIGLGATLFSGPHSNIDLAAAERRGIPVAGVRDYGDIGVGEWVASEAIRYMKREETNIELAGTSFGVIGAGAAGGLTARTLMALGARVSYFSRSRKPHLEAEGIGYRPLHDLLAECSIVSIHLPRNTSLLGADEFRSLGSRKLLFNTSVGLPVEPASLRAWLADPANWFAADSDGIGEMLPDASTHPRIVYLPRSSGYTAEAGERMYAQVERQIMEFLSLGE